MLRQRASRLLAVPVTFITVYTTVALGLSMSTILPTLYSEINDFLFLAARLVAYWAEPIHAAEPLAYTALT